MMRNFVWCWRYTTILLIIVQFILEETSFFINMVTFKVFLNVYFCLYLLANQRRTFCNRFSPQWVFVKLFYFKTFQINSVLQSHYEEGKLSKFLPDLVFKQLKHFKDVEDCHEWEHPRCRHCQVWWPQTRLSQLHPLLSASCLCSSWEHDQANLDLAETVKVCDKVVWPMIQTWDRWDWWRPRQVQTCSRLPHIIQIKTKVLHHSPGSVICQSIIKTLGINPAWQNVDHSHSGAFQLFPKILFGKIILLWSHFPQSFRSSCPEEFCSSVDHHPSIGLSLTVTGDVDDETTAPALHLSQELSDHEEVGPGHDTMLMLCNDMIPDVEVDHPVPGVMVLVTDMLKIVTTSVVHNQIRQPVNWLYLKYSAVACKCRLWFII